MWMVTSKTIKESWCKYFRDLMLIKYNIKLHYMNVVIYLFIYLFYLS